VRLTSNHSPLGLANTAAYFPDFSPEEVLDKVILRRLPLWVKSKADVRFDPKSGHCVARLRCPPVPKAEVSAEEYYFTEFLRVDATCPETTDSSAADFTTDEAVFTTQRSLSRASGPNTPMEPATLPV
jgi:hypothetical protein